MDLAAFTLSALSRARENGLTEAKSFSIVVLGPTSADKVSIQKRITTSFTSPQKAEGSDPEELWLNANNEMLYRLNGDWVPVIDFDSLFFPLGSGLFSGNTATGPIYLPNAPTASTEAVNKGYVDNLVASMAAASSIKTSVSTLDDLRNRNLSSVVDTDLIFVEETGKIYAYDAQAVGNDDGGKTIVRPASGIGRWKTTIQGTLDGGSF